MYLGDQTGPGFHRAGGDARNSFGEVKLSSYRGKYVVLFFYPLDFTFVCPSEIIAFDAAMAKFQRSTPRCWAARSIHTSRIWHGRIRLASRVDRPDQYPLVSDLNKQISRDYGVLLDAGIALRGLFLIDKAGMVRHA